LYGTVLPCLVLSCPVSVEASNAVAKGGRAERLLGLMSNGFFDGDTQEERFGVLDGHVRTTAMTRMC
jgi:hypothetical protein